MTTKKLTKLLALYLPYLLLGLVATNLGEAWRLAEGKELGDKIMSMMAPFRWRLQTLCPACIRLIFWWVCAAAQGCDWRSICVAKTPRSTVTAWSMALPVGEPVRILLPTSTRCSRTMSFSQKPRA